MFGVGHLNRVRHCKFVLAIRLRYFPIRRGDRLADMRPPNRVDEVMDTSPDDG